MILPPKPLDHGCYPFHLIFNLKKELEADCLKICLNNFINYSIKFTIEFSDLVLWLRKDSLVREVIGLNPILSVLSTLFEMSYLEKSAKTVGQT